MRVYNAPDGYNPKISDTLKTANTNKDREFSSGYSEPQNNSIGEDQLKFSEDYTPKPYDLVETNNSDYSKLIRGLFILIGLIALLAGLISTMIAIGGLVFLIVFSLIFLVFVFLYTLKINPLSFLKK